MVDPNAKGKKGRGPPKKNPAVPHSTVQPLVTPDADTGGPAAGATNAMSLPGATTATAPTATTAASQQLIKVLWSWAAVISD